MGPCAESNNDVDVPVSAIRNARVHGQVADYTYIHECIMTAVAARRREAWRSVAWPGSTMEGNTSWHDERKKMRLQRATVCWTLRSKCSTNRVSPGPRSTRLPSEPAPRAVRSTGISRTSWIDLVQGLQALHFGSPALAAMAFGHGLQAVEREGFLRTRGQQGRIGLQGAARMVGARPVSGPQAVGCGARLDRSLPSICAASRPARPGRSGAMRPRPGKSLTPSS